jgi:hypothetical protein
MMRVNPERTRWVQALHSDTYRAAGQTTIQYGGRYYRVFGDDDPARRFIDRLTGVFYSTWPGGKDFPESRKGNAIIHACSYNPLDPYYGMPVQVPALQAIMEDDMTAKFMCAFLEKGTQVPILFIVEKGQLTPASSEKIEALFNSDSKGLYWIGDKTGNDDFFLVQNSVEAGAKVLSTGDLCANDAACPWSLEYYPGA